MDRNLEIKHRNVIRLKTKPKRYRPEYYIEVTTTTSKKSSSGTGW